VASIDLPPAIDHHSLNRPAPVTFSNLGRRTAGAELGCSDKKPGLRYRPIGKRQHFLATDCHAYELEWRALRSPPVVEVVEFKPTATYQS
jgi:hypothetical protein